MRIHLGGSSRQSLVTARGALDAAVKGSTSASASELSSHLFFASDLLASNTALRRGLTDPSRNSQAKATLVKDLFSKTLSAEAISLITEVSGFRWSATKDLISTFEQLAIEAEASAANISGDLDRVEDELFAFSRAITENFELRKALVGTGSTQAKSALVTDVIGKNFTTSTTKLTIALVTSLRGRSIEAAFADYLYALAARRNRLIATVRVASEITSSQSARLASALEKQVGQPIRVNVQIDPSIVGGLSVKFADELIDGSISNRLAGAARVLAGKN